MKHLAFLSIPLALLFVWSAPGFAASSASEPDGTGIAQTSRAFVPSALPAAPESVLGAFSPERRAAPLSPRSNVGSDGPLRRHDWPAT